MGVAVAGYANTVGAKLEDTSLRGTCFLESEWDADGDRTFVLKVGLDFDEIDACVEWSGVEWRGVDFFFLLYSSRGIYCIHRATDESARGLSDYSCGRRTLFLPVIDARRYFACLLLGLSWCSHAQIRRFGC